MQMSGEQHVQAPRQTVWEALNDPAVLAKCIPGCQSLDKQAEDRFAAVAEVKIGPIGARFNGNVQLSDIDAPNGYTISGSGNGGIVGSAKGSAKVRLSDAAGGGTLISYAVEAEVGGRMAQLGGPIIDATAKSLSGKFFAQFGDVVSGRQKLAPQRHTAPVESTATPPVVQPVSAPTARAIGIWGWIAALIMAILTGYQLGRSDATGGMIAAVIMLLLVVAGAAYEAGRRGGGR